MLRGNFFTPFDSFMGIFTTLRHGDDDLICSLIISKGVGAQRRCALDLFPAYFFGAILRDLE